MDSKTLIAFVNKTRAAQGITQDQLAELMNTNQSRVNRYLNGGAVLSWDMGMEMLEVLGRNLNDVQRYIERAEVYSKLCNAALKTL
jgi:transcriptional regulator with XRE-family HTH domain